MHARSLRVKIVSAVVFFAATLLSGVLSFEYAEAGSVSGSMDCLNCGTKASTVSYGFSTDKDTYAPGATINLTLSVVSDDAPVPSYCADVRIGVGSLGPDLVTGCWNAELLTGGIEITYQLTAPATAGSYEVWTDFDLPNYSSTPSQKIPITVSAPTLPKASLFVNGSKNVSVYAGQPLNYTWQGNDGTSYSSTYSTQAQCPGGPGGEWEANTVSSPWPSLSRTAGDNQTGCTYTMTYNVTGPGGSASDSVTVRIVPQPSCFWEGPINTVQWPGGTNGVKYGETTTYPNNGENYYAYLGLNPDGARECVQMWYGDTVGTWFAPSGTWFDRIGPVTSNCTGFDSAGKAWCSPPPNGKFVRSYDCKYPDGTTVRTNDCVIQPDGGGVPPGGGDPKGPTWINGTCDASGNVTVDWETVGTNATYYALRIGEGENGPMVFNKEDVADAPFSEWKGTPGKTYRAWIHSCNEASGCNWSESETAHSPLFTCNATQPPSNNPYGWLDEANCSVIRGWACDANNYAAALNVEIKSDGSVIGTAQASIERTGLGATQCGGNDFHEFSMPTPASIKDGSNHTIQATGINIGLGENAELSGSPMTLFACQPPLPLPTADIWVVASPIPDKTNATFRWTSTNADWCELYWDAGIPALNPESDNQNFWSPVGEVSVGPLDGPSWHTMSIRCRNATGFSPGDTAQVQVLRPIPPPIPTGELKVSCDALVASAEWTRMEGATHYALRVDNQTTGGWNNSCNESTGDFCADIPQAAEGPISYSWTGVANNTYNVWIHACAGPGWNCSAPTGIAVPVTCSVLPPQPTNFTVTTSGACGGNIDLKWDPVPGATRYEVSPDGGVSYIDIGNMTTWRHTSLLPGSSHSYTVRAVNSAGAGPATGSASANASAACTGDTISLVPQSSETIPLGDSVTYALSATDADGDMAALNFDYIFDVVGEKWDWDGGGQGKQSPIDQTFTARASFDYKTDFGQNLMFTPEKVGKYRVRGAARDPDDADGWRHTLERTVTVTEPGGLPECSDTLDNDGDGKIDYPTDPGCDSNDDDDETDGEKECSDGLDNDGDGKIDYPADPGCDSSDDDDETDGGICSNPPCGGGDGDGDGDGKNTLSVTVKGSGSIVSEPSGINCSSSSDDCTAKYGDGVKVTLTATADSGQSFTRWLGDCSADGDNICELTMDKDRSARAEFTGPGCTPSCPPPGGDGPILTADDRIVKQGGKTTLRWDLNGNSGCKLTGGGLNMDISSETGSLPNITVNATTKFTLSCGLLSDSVWVYIDPTGYET